MKNMGCLLVFSLPFAAVGVFMLNKSVINILEWRAAKSWVETPATIIDLELASSTDSEGSTTYEALARYRYNAGGQDFEGARVALYEGADNIGDFHQLVFDELRPYWQSGDTYRCFVDPKDPTRALLNREMRWGMIGFQMVFVVMFGGAGFGIMIFALYAIRKNSRA